MVHWFLYLETTGLSMTKTVSEIRLSSDQSQSVRWTVGAYWDSQYQDIDREVHIDGNLGGVGNTLFALGVLPTNTIMALTAAQAAGAGLVNVLPFHGHLVMALLTCRVCHLLVTQVVNMDSYWPLLVKTFLHVSFKQFNQIGRLSNWTQDTDAKAFFGQVNMDLG